MTKFAVLDGLNGWFRWGHYAAHFFVSGEQTCNTPHGLFEGASLTPVRPKPAELSTHGVPFGRVCARCLKLQRLANPRSKDGGRT